MKNLGHLFLTLICLAVLLLARADGSHLYTAEAGLSSTRITCLAQDRYGFLWVGTENGLNRFDGYRFTTYQSHAGDTTSLPSDEINAFLVDRQGRLWVGCNKGLAEYIPETGAFRRYRLSTTYLPRVESIVETHEGDILFGTAGYGLYVIRHGTDKPEHLESFTRTNTDEFASRLHVDSLHHLLRGSYKPTITIATIDGKLTPKRFQDQQLAQAGPVVKYICTRARELVVCMYGILAFDPKSGRLADAGYDLSAIGRKTSIRTALVARDGTIYLGTSGRGIFLARPGEQRFEAIAHQSTQFDLSQTHVNDLLEDKDGNLWVSCYNKGLYQISTARTAFSTHTFTAQDIRLGSSVSSIAPADDGTWVTVQNSGIYHFTRDGRITERRTQPEGAQTIYRDRTGRYWLGTESALYAYDVASGQATERIRLDGWGANCMADDNCGTLYVSNYGKGLVALNTATGATTTFSMNGRGAAWLPNDWVKSLLTTTNGQLWVGSADGLARLDNHKAFTIIKGFEGMQCLSLCELRGGRAGQHTLLVGTDHGLYRVLEEHGKAEPFPHSDDIGATSIYGIVEDRAGDIWLSTANGIWQYDRHSEQWRGHIGGAGLASREYVVGAALYDERTDGVCFGIGDGITTFEPRAVRQTADTVTSPRLTRIVIGGRERGCIGSRYDIDYQDNTLTLEFSLLNFHNPDNVIYEYRLGDEPWTPIADGSNQLTLNKLEPGTYHLAVRAANGGTHSSEPCTLTISVGHPWYSSPLAWVCYVLAVVAIIALIIYQIDRRRRISTEEAKMRFLINATHDIRSPLTLILGPLKKLRERFKDDESQDDIDTIDRNAQRLLLLVNQILDERRIDKNQMRLHCEPTDLVRQVQGICSMYQYNAHQRHITFAIDHEPSEVKVWIDRQQFDKVLTNLLSNAFKYTLDGGEIRFSIEQTATEAIVRLTDTGPGLRGDKTEKLFERFYQGRNAQTLHVEGTGIGLNLSRAIVRLHGGTITAYNRRDGLSGATFEVRLPLGKGHLAADQIMTDNGEANTQAAPTDSSAKSKANRGQYVMVVDDDHELADYVATELSAWFRCTTFDNGRDALDALLKGDYDLVISDVVMPEMDGLQLLRAIKTNPHVSHVPVILLTSKSEADHRVEGLKKGADGYISKPFNMEELRAMAVNLIDNVRRLRGKFSGAQQQEELREHVAVKGNDDQLMERIMRSLNAHLSDPDFKVDSLTQDVGISRAQLHRKLKDITGLPAGEFIRNLRLDEAKRLLSEGQLSVTQVTYAVGFSSQSHFSTLFHKRFGITPKEFIEQPKEILKN